MQNFQKNMPLKIFRFHLWSVFYVNILVFISLLLVIRMSHISVDLSLLWKLWVSRSLTLKGLFLYTVGVLFHAECCIRQLWHSSTISCNITIIAYNHYTDKFSLSNIKTYKQIYHIPPRAAHRGLTASRCCAMIIINRSESAFQIANIQMVHGRRVEFLGSDTTGYEAESRALMPGGVCVVFAYVMTAYFVYVMLMFMLRALLLFMVWT